jgi:hypothetical protein
MKHIPRVRTGLLQHKLDDQVLVYDPGADRVHLLDPTTACVITLLEEGGWTREGIVAEVSRRLNVTASDSLVPLAFEELRAAELLEDDAADAPMVDVSRRDLVRKAVIAGATALLLPAIVTYTATPGYAGGSGAGSVGLCGACTPINSQGNCATGNACNNVGACCNGCNNKKPNGASCSGGGNCCSGTCTSSICTA